MHCIVLASPKSRETWEVVRSIEILGYHKKNEHTDGCVRILYGLLIKNKLKNNILRILHRGNVTLRPQSSWELPTHPDDNEGKLKSISGFYDNAFRREEHNLYYVNELKPWDSWDKKEIEEPVIPYPFTESELKSPLMPQYPIMNRDASPFTTWELNRFSDEGYYLITFTMEFTGITYERLLEDETSFTVDGPQRLITRIESMDMIRVPYDERTEWEKVLQDFKNPFNWIPSKSYDLLFLGAPYAHPVKEVSDAFSNGVVLAPEQIDDSIIRYVTTSQYFTISMCYADKDNRNSTEEVAEAHQLVST